MWEVKILGGPGFSEAERESAVDWDAGLVEGVRATYVWGRIFIPPLSSFVICKWFLFPDAQLQFA